MRGNQQPFASHVCLHPSLHNVVLVIMGLNKICLLISRMQPEPCARPASSCSTVELSVRVAGRLMQQERLENAATDEHYQGNQASLPLDLVELVRHYEQVLLCASSCTKKNLTSCSAGWNSLTSAIVVRRWRQFIRPFFADALFFYAQLLASHAHS